MTKEEQAIRAGCEGAEVHLICAYPGCTCVQIPRAIKAALAFMAAAPGGQKEALDLYNASAARVGWPKATSLTATRRKQLGARLGECGGLEGWKAAMAKAEASSFLSGRTGRSGDHSNWRPTLDFFLQPGAFTKLREGGFDDAKPTGRAAPSTGFNL